MTRIITFLAFLSLTLGCSHTKQTERKISSEGKKYVIYNANSSKNLDRVETIFLEQSSYGFYVSGCVANKQHNEFKIERETCEPLGDGHITGQDLENITGGNGVGEIQRSEKLRALLVRSTQFGIIGAAAGLPYLLSYILDSNGIPLENTDGIGMLCGYILTQMGIGVGVSLSLNKFIGYNPTEIQQMRDIIGLQEIFNHKYWRKQADGSQQVCSSDFENFRKYLESLTRG